MHICVGICINPYLCMYAEERKNLHHEEYTWHRLHICHSNKCVLTADMKIRQDFGFSDCLLSLEV